MSYKKYKISGMCNKTYMKIFLIVNFDNEELYLTELFYKYQNECMHITLLSTIILLILNKIKKSNINYIFVSIFLIFYMFLTNFTPSVIRAT